MQHICVVCGQKADVFCHNDSAYLCFTCDHTVHSAHELAKTHKRVPIDGMNASFVANASSSADFEVETEPKGELIHLEHHFSTSEDDLDFIDPWCSVPSSFAGPREPSGPGSQEVVKQMSNTGMKQSAKTEKYETGLGPADPVWDDDDFLRSDLFDFDFEDNVNEAMFMDRETGQSAASYGLSPFMLDSETECLMVPESDANVVPECPKGRLDGSDTSSAVDSRDTTSNCPQVTCPVYNNPAPEITTLARPGPTAPMHQIACPVGDHGAGDWFSSYIPHCLRPIDSETRMNQLQERRLRVQRFREKKKNRQFKKLIRYASRKRYAEVRPRIKGRFARKDEILAAQATGVPLC